MYKLITVLVILAIGLAQDYEYPKYLPKEGPVPLCDVYARDITRSGKNDFWKVDRTGWGFIYSALPVRPGVITQVTFYLVVGNVHMMGITSRDKVNGERMIKNAYYVTNNGMKCLYDDANSYGSTAIAGDKISMTIDMRSFEWTLSYAKNGLDMGIAHNGFNYWGTDIYFFFGIG